MLAIYTVTNHLDAPVNTPAAIGTLRQAIQDANTLTGADTIQFDPSLIGTTIALTQGELDISDPVTIDGTYEGASLGVTIDAGNGPNGMPNDYDGDPIFDVFTSGQVEINDLTLKGGDSLFAGAILSGITSSGVDFPDTQLTVKNALITGNSSDFGGGGIAAYSGDVTIENSTITGNTAAFGGGLFALSGNLDIENSTVSGNYSQEKGAGISFESGDLKTLTIAGSTISGNTSDGEGGGIYAGTYTDVDIQSSHISGNQANDRGGGLFLNDCKEVTMQSSEVQNNYSSGFYGGGLYDSGDFQSLTIQNTIFEIGRAHV